MGDAPLTYTPPPCGPMQPDKVRPEAELAGPSPAAKMRPRPAPAQASVVAARPASERSATARPLKLTSTLPGPV